MTAEFDRSMQKVLRVMAGDGFSEMVTVCTEFGVAPPGDGYFSTLNDILIREIEEYLFIRGEQ